MNYSQEQLNDILFASICLNLNHYDSLLWAINQGANINQPDKDGITPLSCAIYNRNKNAVQILLEAGANPNIQNQYGNAALHQASCQGYADIVKILLEAGANPNIQNQSRETPLHFAAENDKGAHEEVIQRLLVGGADPMAQNPLNDTPLSMATNGQVPENGAAMQFTMNYITTASANMTQALRIKMQSFLLGKHPRVGTKSLVKWLPPELIEMIAKQVVTPPTQEEIYEACANALILAGEQHHVEE